MVDFTTKETRRGGVLIPLSALLSYTSFECGDIGTLIPFGEWAGDVGFSIIQLLPLNDTGFGNSPYSAISAFAIDPIYISLSMIGLSQVSRRKEIPKGKLNFNRIRNLKLQSIREVYEKNLKENQSLAKQFLEKHPWGYAYASFRQILVEQGGKNWWEWPEEFLDPEKGKEYAFSKRIEESLFWIYLQKIAFEQLSFVKQNFEAKGLLLKGDMPILTSKNSSDVWENKDYFYLDLHAGAPPDQFSPSGQNWGFPVLNWERLKKNNYQWWKDRLTYLENFFHLYRIDHVIGMYRIWAVPSKEVTALNGWFHPQLGTPMDAFLDVGLDPLEFVQKELIYEFKQDHFIFFWDFWKKESYINLSEEVKSKLFPLSELNLKEDEELWQKAGSAILELFSKHSNMTPCAEDLGSVPTFIRESLFELQMMGIDVVRWTRSFETGEFIPNDGYRKLAISTLSTHDTSLAMDWWKNEGDLNEKLNFFFLKQGKPIPTNDDEVLLGLLDFVFHTESVFSIQLMSDLCLFESEISSDPAAHRINIPGTPDSENWNYRFPFTIEEFAKNTERNQILRKLLLSSDRM